MLHDKAHKSIIVSILSWECDMFVAHITVHCILKKELTFCHNWFIFSGFT